MKARLIFLCTLFLLLTPVLQAELRIIKLVYSQPEAIKSTLQQLFGDKIKAAVAPSLNAVIINCDDPAILQEIDRLAAALDRKPALLKFSLKRSADATSRSNSLTVGRHGGLKNSRQKSRETNVNTVIALEHRKARITQDMIHIFSYPTWYGQESEAITISHGLRVSGHLINQNFAQIALWYAEGQNFSSETLLTTIEAPIGQWISLGAIQENNSQNSQSLNLKKNTQAVKKKTGGFISRQYLLKVDLLNN